MVLKYKPDIEVQNRAGVKNMTLRDKLLPASPEMLKMKN